MPKKISWIFGVRIESFNPRSFFFARLGRPTGGITGSAFSAPGQDFLDHLYAIILVKSRLYLAVKNTAGRRFVFTCCSD